MTKLAEVRRQRATTLADRERSGQVTAALAGIRSQLKEGLTPEGKRHIICLLLDQGFSYLEVPVKAVERRGAEKSHALTPRNIVSVAHTLIDLLLRRVSRWIY